MNHKRYAAIAAKLEDLPAELDDQAAFEQAYGEQLDPLAVYRLCDLMRHPQFEQMLHKIAVIPKAERQQLSNRHVFERICPDFVTFDEFRYVFLEERPPAAVEPEASDAPATEVPATADPESDAPEKKNR